MDMKNELNKLYKGIIKQVEAYKSLEDDDITICKHNLKNLLIDLGRLYYEESIRIALDCIDMSGVD